jgi:transcriptional regulator with XRE-family HTH domain
MINSKYQNPESLVLRFMREKRQLTLLVVGKELGIKPKDLDYIEKGIKPTSKEEILRLLDYYNYSFEIFIEMTQLKPLNKQSTNHFFLIRT